MKNLHSVYTGRSSPQPVGATSVSTVAATIASCKRCYAFPYHSRSSSDSFFMLLLISALAFIELQPQTQILAMS